MLCPLEKKNRMFLVRTMLNSLNVYSQSANLKNRLYILHSKTNIVNRVNHVQKFFDNCSSSKKKKFVVRDLFAGLIQDNGPDLAHEVNNAMEFFLYNNE
jgi:hypothetical protein